MHQNAHDTDTCFPNRNISVRKIVPEDQETLRTWRHAHSQRFFDREKISPAQQRQRFTHYLTRDEDHLFMVLVNALPTGCIGIRLLDDHWDLYNVIRGVHRLHSRGCMGTALHHVIEFALQRKAIPVQLKVLAKNLRTTGIKIIDFLLSKLRKTTLSCSIRLFHRHLQTS